MAILTRNQSPIDSRPEIIPDKDWDILNALEKHLTNLENPGKPALLSRALIGSAEKTLQGEVFFAFKNNKEYENKTVLEANLTDWNNPLRRYCDVTVFDDFPRKKEGTFIELGHHTYAQGANAAIPKIVNDLNKQTLSKQSKKLSIPVPVKPLVEFGATIHCMFITSIWYIGASTPPAPTNPSGRTGGAWAPLLKYFRKNPHWKLDATPSHSNYLTEATSLDGAFSTRLGANYLGHVIGQPESTLIEGRITVKGRVDRFYCYLPRNSHLLLHSSTPTPCAAGGNGPAPCPNHPIGIAGLPDSLTEMVDSQESEAQAPGS